jgi:hypothetical protein
MLPSGSLLQQARIGQLNRETMVRQRQRADAVRNMLWHAWNNSRKNRFPDCNPRYRFEIDLKSTHAKPIG